MKWFLKALKQYADFRGRARRREWWWFYLFANVPSAVFVPLLAVLVPNLSGASGNTKQGMVMLFGFFGVVLGLYAVALLIPSIAVTVRRFHDVGLSGWLLLTPFLSFAFVLSGSFEFFFYSILAFQIAFLVVVSMDGQRKSNKYGPDPKDKGFPASTTDRMPVATSECSVSGSGRSLVLEGINPQPDSPASLKLKIEAAMLRRKCVLGRRKNEVDYTVPNTSISGRHACLWEGDGRFFIQDLESSNGTRVNGRDIPSDKPTELSEGDSIELGEVRLTLRYA